MSGGAASADSSRGMLRRLAREESGIALVLALVTMAVLASLTTAVTIAVTVNHRSAGQSANADIAFSLAQLGLAYAEGKVYSSAVTHSSAAIGTTAVPGVSPSDGAAT